MNSFKENLITTKDASELSGYTSDYLARLVRAGEISGKRIGHNWLVDSSSLELFLSNQKDRKFSRAQELARTRAEEYRAHVQPASIALRDLTTETRVSEIHLAPVSRLSHALALVVALVVVLSGAAIARADIVSQFAGSAAGVVSEAASGFVETFASVPSNVTRDITTAAGEMQAHAIRVAENNQQSSARLASPMLVAPDLSMLQLAVQCEKASCLPKNIATTHSQGELVGITPLVGTSDLISLATTAMSVVFLPKIAVDAAVQAYFSIGTEAYVGITASFDAYRALINHTGSSMLDLAAASRDMLHATPRVAASFGEMVVGATHAVIGADVAATYKLAIAGPASARATVAFIGTTGDLLAGLVSQVPHLATTLFLRTTEAPARVAPALAQAVFGAEYTGAAHLISFTNGVSDQYLAFLTAAGKSVKGSAGNMHALASALSSIPAAIEDAYLGMLGTTALALDITTHTPPLAAVVSALSVGQQAALTTYQTIHGLFDSATNAFATLFGSTSSSTNAPVPIVAVETPAKQATSTAPVPTRSPTFVSQTVNTYPTYTTLVQGVSQDQLNQSLATLRNSILATTAGMLQPVAAQGVTNMNTIQYVNMIQDLSNLIVRNGSFRGGTFDNGSLTNGISVSATNGNFTNLTGGVTTLGTTTINGDFFVSGTVTPAIVSAGSYISASYFVATSTTATTTLAGSLSIDNGGLVYATSTRNVGIGVLSPAALLAIKNSTSTQPVFTASSAAGTETFRITDAGFVGIGSTSPSFNLAVEGSSSLGNQATAGAFVATTTADNLFPNIVATNSTTTNATTTNFFATKFTAANATNTNLFATNFTAANATNTNFFATNFTAANATNTNFFATNFTAANATNTNFFATNASATNLSLSNALWIGGNATTTSNGNFSTNGTITSGLVNGQTISSAANFTGSVAIAGAVTGATAYNGLTITANSGVITTGTWNGTTIAVANGGTGSTTLTGLLKGNGTSAILSAVSGTDYLAPSSLSATYPIQYSANNFSLAFGTTTSNTWAGTQTFTNTPILSTLSGLIYSNTGVLASVATSTPTFGLGFGTGGTWGSLVGGAAPSLTIATSSLYSGTTGQFPYFSGTNTLTATSSLFLASSGNVGIGTIAPTQKLDVAGNINVSAGSAYKYNGANVITASTTLSNYFFGGAGNLTMTGSNNTGTGLNAFLSNTTGSWNTANGVNALSSNTTGSWNTANGVQALSSNTTGAYNTANGMQALFSNTTGYNNTANGMQALYYNTTGSWNTANGVYALYYNTTGSENTANGVNALYSNTTGAYNTANGVQALYYNTTGAYNTANGMYALYSNTTGYNNTANGVNALYNNTFGYNNTANGVNALYYNTTGSWNTANGVQALLSNTTGSSNTALGYQAGYGDGTANMQSNIDVGATFLGYQASRDASVATSIVLTNATAIGYNAKVAASNSLVLGGTGTYAVNVGIGTTSPGAKLVISNGNLVIDASTVASYSEGVRVNKSSAGYTGFHFGGVAGSVSGTGPGEWTMNSIPSGDLQIYENTASPFVGMYLQKTTGNVGIGTTNPASFKLQVAGNVGPDASNSYNLGASGSNWGCLYYNSGTLGTCASDARLKTDIQPLSFGADPLAQLAGLVPSSFAYTSATSTIYHGLIAQEVLPVAPELVTTGSDGFYQVKYGDVQWLTVAAVQQLAANLGHIQGSDGVLAVESAVNAQCVTGDTRLRRRRRRADGSFEYDEVDIADIAAGDEVLSLDERTGRLVYARVHALMPMGVQEVYELTTRSGRKIRTTANHPYLVRIQPEFA